MARTIGGEVPRPWVGEKFVLLRALNCCGNMEWYMIEISNKENSKIGGGEDEPYCIYPTLAGHFRPLTFCHSLDSTLYLLGSRDIGDGSPRGVYMFDATRALEGFKRGPPMKNARESYLSSTVALGGKLYVFGGALNPEEPWAECFDPKQGNWKPLSSPPFGCPPFPGDTLAVPLDETRIMVCSEGSVLLYNVELDSWDPYPHQIFLDFCVDNPIKVGNTLYWLRGMIYAHDLDSHQTYSGTIHGSELAVRGRDAVSYPFTTPLFHLGGNDFCFFWVQCESSDDGYGSSTFCCNQFQVVKRPTRGRLDVTTVSCQYYSVDHQIDFMDGLPVNRMFVDSLLSEIKKMSGGSS